MKLPPYPVKATLQSGALNIVLLDVPPAEVLNENIYATDEKGEVVWQVKPTPQITMNSPYTTMRVVGGCLQAVTWDGIISLIDPATGMVKEHSWAK